MKKNRTIPFGYMMKNGEIQPESAESKAVQEIFRLCLDGNSLLAIASVMSSKGVSYNGINTVWNKNMVKRILENEKYTGRNGYPVLIDDETFQKANFQKKMKSTARAEISEELQVIRSLTYCAECGHRLSRIGGSRRYEKWDCRNPECSRFGYRITDNILRDTLSAVLNTVIANPDLLDTDSEISIYTPNIEVTRQQNEINRLMDNSDVDFDRIKSELYRLTEMKYDCCTYNDDPQKTKQLMNLLENQKQLNTLDIGLFKSCVNRIWISHFCTIEVEFINGIKIKNITERNNKNDHSIKCQDNSCEKTDGN